MREPAPAMSVEPRWPVILVVGAVLAMTTLLPSRLRVFPSWVLFLLALALIVPMAALSLSTAKARWLRIESIVTLCFLAIIGLAIVFGLREVFSRMLHHSAELTGLQLLSTSVMAWVANVMMFSILYWRMDRGGPEARANHVCTKPDWQFPEQGGPEDGSPEWYPAFADYLFLAFCTATAFSPTEDLPLTSRAKLLMMVESIISLVTIIAVASRAINILS